MATSTKKRIYWDSCVWIRLINEESGHDDCRYVLERAQAGEVEIWCSTLVLAEVLKKKCGGPASISIGPHKDVEFEEFIQQDFVVEVQLDHDIGTRARRLCRKHSVLKKPNDAIHLASALRYSVDEMQTVDNTDLLPLTGIEACDNGSKLLIRVPPPRPALSADSLPLFASP